MPEQLTTDDFKTEDLVALGRVVAGLLMAHQHAEGRRVDAAGKLGVPVEEIVVGEIQTAFEHVPTGQSFTLCLRPGSEDFQRVLESSPELGEIDGKKTIN